MANGFELLIAEVDRVVGSPYPTQLKQLRDIVCTRCSKADIARTSRVARCKVDALVICLLEGLQQWPYVLDIITTLSYELAIRDGLLKHEPDLLQDLLVQACKTDNVQLKYTSAAVAMLSHPLHIDFALPAAVQTLFLRLVDHAAKSPSSSTVRPLHHLLTGTSTSLLGLLSAQALAQFQEQLFSILRNSTARSGQHAEDHSLVLYCLAVMRQVTFASDEQLLLTNSFGATQELLASTQRTSSRWDAGAMRAYFTATGKAAKTVQLVVLRVIEACRHNSNPSMATSLETLNLANEILDAFPMDIKAAWCSVNPLTVERLQQKAMSADVKHGARLHALCFAHNLCQDTMLVDSHDALRTILIQPRRMVEASYDVDDDVWIRAFSQVLDKQDKLDLLRNITEYMVAASPRELVEGSGILKALVKAFGGGDGDYVDVASSPLADPRLQSRLSALAEGPLPFSRGHHGSFCEQSYLRTRQELVHMFSSLLLRCALRNGQSNSEHMINLLLGLHAGSAMSQIHCSHTRTPRAGKISFVEQESTPPDAVLGWRDVLQHHLHMQAQTNQDTLSTVFAQACADLEARCENVELPLRQEQESRVALQEEYDQLSVAYTELEANHVARKLELGSIQEERGHCMRELGSIQEEKVHCMRELDDTRREHDDALERVDRLQGILEQSKTDAEVEMSDLRRAREAADLRHATTFADKEAQLEELQEHLELTNSTLCQRTAELERSRKGLQESEKGKDDFHAEVQRLQGDLRDLNAANDGLHIEAEGLRGDVQARETTIDMLNSALRDGESHRNDLSCEMQSLQEEQEKAQHAHESHLQQIKAHGKQNLEAANASHNDTMDRLAAQHGEEVAKIERKLFDARDESHRLQEEYTSDLAQREERMEELHEKITELRRECKNKDRQISEANAMRGNLMAAMGLGGIPVPASLPHRTRSSAPLTQGEYSQLEMSQSKALHAEGEGTPNFDGRASFASNASSGEYRTGPTPKRPRPRKSFKAASPAKARVSTGAKTGRTSLLGRSTVKRQPLVSLSVNRSPTRIAPKTPSKVVAMKNADEFDDSTFDEHEMFSRASGRRMANMESMMDGHS